MTDFSSFNVDGMFGDSTKRPHLRRDPLPEVRSFRLRLSLNKSDPEIWREVLVRSDITLPVLHQVIQACFLWWDYHLYRFSLGGGVYESTSELFLCPVDEQEPDPYQQGTPARLVRLDETVQKPGDVLNYLYDFGDDWDLTITLTEVLERDVAGDVPVAEYIAGERAAPPEDCGGRRTAAELVEMTADPETGHLFADFDPDVVDAAAIVRQLGPVEWWARATASPDYVRDLLAGFPVLEEIYQLVARTAWPVFLGTKLEILEGPTENLPYELPEAAAKAEALSGITAFLQIIDDAGKDGVKLTASGYLPPKVVEALMVELPALEARYTKGCSESKMRHILGIRESLTNLGLLRKYKGRLKLGRWARVPLVDPELLWDHLVEGIATAVSPDPQVAYPRDFVVDTTSLLLLCLATSRLPAAEKAAIRDLLTAYGWRDEDGSEVDGYDVNFASPYLMLLGEIGPLESRGWLPEEHSDAAAALAREALLASHR